MSCPAAAACTAIGSLGSAAGAGQAAILAAHWDGRTWTPQPVPAPAGGPGQMHSVACASAKSCVAAGVNYAPGAEGAPGAGRQWPASVVWNGSTWKLAPVPRPRQARDGAYLYGVDCSAATACTAAGSYTPGTEGGPTMAGRWNGTFWSLQDSKTPSGDTAELTSVSCPASRVCIAVGDSGTNARPEHTLAERWNGSAWTLSPTPLCGGGSRRFIGRGYGRRALIQRSAGAISCPPSGLGGARPPPGQPAALIGDGAASFSGLPRTIFQAHRCSTADGPRSQCFGRIIAFRATVTL